MTDWKNIHPDFTEQLSCEWTDRGFTFEQTKTWINNGLIPNEAAFANYLQNKGYNAEQIINYDLGSLKKDYNSRIEGKGKEVMKIDQVKGKEIEYFLPFDMERELRKIALLNEFEHNITSRENWWEKGFTYEQAQDWIKLGLEINEEDLAAYISEKMGYSEPWGIPGDFLPELRENFEKYQLDMAIAMSLKANEVEKNLQVKDEEELTLKAQIQEQERKN